MRRPGPLTQPLRLLLLLAASARLVAARDAPGACRGSIPGCGTDRCVNRLVGGSPTMVCPFCDKAAAALYALSADQTRCDCVPGAYANCTSPPCECRACPSGSWCRGGRNSPTGAAAVSCGVGRTTAPGIIATKRSHCEMLPGWGWSSTDAAAPQLCAVGYYEPGGSTSRIPCTRCPSRLTTLATGSVSKLQCVAGPGRFFSASLGGAQPCPTGMYQPAFVTTDNGTACQPCPAGVTTLGAGTKAAFNCSVALPGYGLQSVCDGVACQGAATAALCAVGSYNPGGADSSSCVPCPWGLTTQAAGSTSEDDCLVPPGSGLLQPLPANRSASAVAPCSFSYNPGWNREPCVSCGINVAALNNRTSAADCYVLRGQGLRLGYNAGGARVREAVDCAAGSFGAANDTPADVARPCDTCPRYMTTAAPLAAGKSACAAQPGYTIGVNIFGQQAAVACAVGTFKTSIGNSSCTACPGGTTTAGTGAAALSTCSLCLAGTGSSTPPTVNCTQCSVNTFNNGSFAACQPCPLGYTSTAGASACFRTSVCVPRPAASAAANVACPVDWGVVPAGLTAGLPPRCISLGPNLGNCKEFEAFVGLPPGGATKLQYPGQGVECACGATFNNQRDVVAGFVPQYVAGSNTSGACVNAAVFLPAAKVSGNVIPATTAGVWLDALTTAQKACGSHRACWDLCFFCDGTRRYATQAGFAPDQTKGFRWFRNVTAGSGNSTAGTATLISTLTSADNREFALACEAFGAGGAALPEQNALLNLTVASDWPYRPSPLSGRTTATLYQLVQPLPAGFAVNRGQAVMEAFGANATARPLVDT